MTTTNDTITSINILCNILAILLFYPFIGNGYVYSFHFAIKTTLNGHLCGLTSLVYGPSTTSSTVRENFIETLGIPLPHL